MIMAAIHGVVWVLYALLVLPSVQVSDAACANSCSGHGRCGSSNQCTCDADWALAPDCSMRKCPTGVAWTDKAKTANVAHAMAECSNRGVCDYSKGECTCFNGYTGAACQRLRCPSDCSGHGLCYSSATLALQYGPDSLPSVAGDGVGPVYSNWEKNSMSSCMCDMGYTGPDCSQIMCAKNDDPLTTGQGFRTIQIQVGADATTNLALAGSIRVHFLGDVAVFSAVAVADATHEQACAQAFQSMRTVLSATCSITSVDPVTAGATYTVTFKEWVHLGGENNLLYHDGNPPLSSFSCDLTKVTSLNSPTCAVSDVTATNVVEHVYCSNRGLCDFTTGQCVCYADFKGLDCNQPSNVPDSIDDNDGFIINPMGLTYTGTVLHLKTAKGSQADFYFMKIGSSTLPILTMDGMGDTKLLNGDFELSTGSLTITTVAQTSTAADIANTHTTFTGTALKVRTTRASNTAFKLLEAMTGDTTTVVEIRGDGLTTIYTGGLYVVTGGGTISHTLNGPSLTVTNSYGSFSNSLLKLSTSRASLFPTATDFVLIEATANSVPAFTVEASGRTTIANGGLIVNGLGGAQISNSDPAASALVVSATGTSFADDAVAIKTFSGVAHNMMKVTTKVGSNTAIALFTISNSGLTTITQGGLYVMAGGATIDTGGLHVGYGGATIDYGGLLVKNGGGTIELGGLNVIDGGGKIASTMAVSDILAIEATSASFSNNARVLYINSKSAVAPSTSMHYLVEATVGASATSVFTLDATGLTTIAGQGSGGASISDNAAATDTLKVSSRISTGFTGTLLSLNAVSTTKLYTLIDAKSSGTSRFKVAASGLTTIVGSGSGGASISDSAADLTSTLSVSNTAASGFTGSLLYMSATASDKLYTFINSEASGTSVFKVDATGLTTIAGQGSGGASISDNAAATDTLKVSSRISTGFTGTLLSLNAVSTTKLYTLIDAKSSGTSRFKVAASGLTTIVGSGSGGAIISDSNSATTSTLAIENTDTTRSFSGTLLGLDTTTLQATDSFSLIDAKVLTISKFTVAASGLTTITGGGLSVTGGITAVDTGVTVTKGGARIADDTDINTLKLTNTFATLTKTVLDMATTDTAGFFFIDAKVGSTPTSVFKVDATGATTIAAGGLTVTKGGATIADNTDMSTLTLTNTVGTLTNTVLALNSADTDGTGFLFIDAKLTATPTSVFKVDATGATTIAAGGLTVTKGGATIADNTDMSTLTLTNTVGTLTNTVLALNSADTDGTGFLFIDAKLTATPTSVFKVDATGATTIAAGGLTVGGGVTVSNTGLTVSAGGASITGGITAVDTGVTVTKGGARIADDTDINTLKLTNTFATLTKTVLDMATTDTAGFFFIDAKVGSTPTSVFKVDATGATTIAAGGLTVTKGGATIADNTDMSTLTLTNTVGTLTNTVLALNSADTDGTGFLFIDAKLTATPTSVFKVDATGATTIAAGGLTVTKGGATIADNTDMSTLTLTNTVGTLTNTVLALNSADTDGTGFLFIDAKLTATPTSVFKVDATGATTIAAGGLTVTKGGATIADNTDMSTLTLTNTVGTLTNTVLALNSADTDGTGFLFIDAKLTATPTSVFKVDATGATTIAAGGLTVGGGVTVSNTGLTVSAGGASITGGITAVDTGVTVTKGGARIADDTDINTLKLTNTFATLTKTVLDMATTDTAGFFFIDAKVGSTPTSVFKVDATGATTIAAGGLTVTKGGATIADNTDMSTLTLTNTVGTLTNTVLALNSADTDGTGFLFIDAKLTATPTSVFKVDATGATTIAAGGLTVTKGGATIADNTDMSTLTLTNTVGTLTNTVLALNSADTDGTGFLFIDAKLTATPTSVFKVDATGATTIAAGGLTVTKGGATIADNTDMSTLTLTNTVGTLTNTVLALNSADTDGTGFLFIDAKLTATPTSVFKVDATGATTIAAGGLTVTKGGATIADNTDMSTLTLTNTVGTLTNTVLALNSADTDGTGFLFIDAKLTATPTSVFKVDATGATTIAAGGLTVTKGGATIADNTDMSTLTLTNTVGTLTNTVLALNSADTDGTGFLFIDAKLTATPTSVFKVDATGATTIAAGGLTVGGGVTVSNTGLTVSAGGASITGGITAVDTGVTVTKGGARIADDTDINTLKLTNTFATLTKTVLDMATTDTAGFFFIDAKVGSTPTSVFKVDATGATTIAAGGLTVTKGGATIADNTDMSTLTLTNTVGTLTNTVLALNSADTDGTGFLFIDAKLTATPTSVFKVDATGATTIAAGGLTVGGGVTVSNTGLTVSAGGASITGGITAVDTGVTVTKGGARIADDTDINTLKLTNTFATLTKTVLDMATTDTAGFFFIDAKVGSTPTSVFKVDATGATTIAAGGLTVTKGGATIADNTDMSTLTLTNTVGTLTNTVLALNSADTDGTGFLFIDAKLTATPTSVFKVDATGATTIAAGGLTVGGGVTVSNTGLTVSAGGASITGGITAVDTGVTVTKGGARIADDTDINTLKLTNTFATLTKTVLDMATTDTAGFFFIDAKVGSTPTSVFKVDATGATTIAAGGLTVDAGGVTVGGGGLSVASGGATITAGGLTVTDGGASISKTTDAATLTLSNTFATLTKTVLDMATTDTAGFFFIDAKVGSTPTSVFKVDATGATTIAAGGLIVGGGVTVSNTGLTVSAGGASITGGITAVDTGVTVTKGGARIADDTDINTLKLTNTFATLTKTVLDMATTDTAGFFFIDAKVGSTPTSVFKVDATGATTIAAGGLTVTKGGATIADNTDMSTLTLTNTVGTLTNTVLALNSADTDGTGFLFIDAKLTATPTSVFKVDATGATTIAAGGLTVGGGVTVSNTGLTVSAGGASITGGITAVDTGVTVTKGGARIADDTDINTLKLTNTFATLTKTVLDMATTDTAGFFFIDAKVGSTPTSVFKVDATGATTIAAGGLTVDAGGVTVGGGGLSVASGGATITAGGLTVTDGGASISKTTDAATLTLSNTFATLTKTVLDMATTDTAGFFFIDAKVGSTPTSVFKVDATGATTIAAGGLTVGGGVTVSNTGLTVSAGGASITGGITAVDTGVTVTKGGARIADDTDINTLKLTNTFATLTKTVLDMATTDTAGFFFIDAKVGSTPTSVFKVDATGATTIAAGGLTVDAGGVTVGGGGLSVASGGATITVGGLTVTDGGASISKTTDAATLTLSNTFATLTKTVLDMATTDTAGFFFIDAKVGSTPTSVFKVDATGATTIAAGGLTVGGGVTVSNTGLTVSAGGASITGGITAVDTGVTVTKGGARIADDTDINTLKLTNTFATLTKTVLDMATTDTAGFFFIDAKVGSTPTSVFKVDATGATTIAAGGLTVDAGGVTVGGGGLSVASGGATITAGGLTVTDGGASISKTTDAATLTLSNTFATLTKTVLDMATTDTAGFFFIDAKVGSTPTSVFKVDATGATTIAAGGLTVGGGVTVSNTGLTVSAGGASITGGITAVDTGVTVTKGGARIADDTDINTLKLTNTFATLTKTVLDMATTDTAGFFFIDAKVGSTPTSVFKVDATGATTIAAGGLTVDAGGVTVGGGGLSVASGGATITAGGLTVTDGGASISKTTDAATLTLSNTFATLTKTVLDMATTDTAGFFFIDAKVGSTPTSVFKVDATGATTIAAGGLTVTKGGATIADNTDMSTLTLTNTVGTLTNTVLALNSADTDGTGFLFIDAKLTATPTSVFKVDATGATTIAAGGLTVGGGVTVSNTGLTVSAGGASITGGITAVDTGVTVTKGGARIADDTDINTLKLTNTFATLTKTVLDMATTDTAGFFFIDAKVGSTPTSVFKVDATGATTIAAGGLTVTKGGATIADNTDMSTLTLTNTVGTLTNTVLALNSADTDGTGFLFIDAKLTATPTSVFKVDATGATTIAAGGLTVGGGVTVSNTGLTVSAGGASITGGITAVDTGVTVTKGGARIADDTDINTLKLTNTFATLTKTVLDMATTDTAGFFFIDAKVGSTPTSVFKVDATGATTIAAGGLTVTKGGATIADNTDMSTLTLTNTVGTLTNTVLALNSADTDGTGFLFIDAKLTATPTSVFKVDATGATTIAAGGLTVGGGVTVSNTGLTVSAGGASITGGITAVDTGVTVTKGGARIADDTDINTLKLTNTFATLTKTVLDMATTDTAGFFFIDAKVGSTPTSVFKVDATGATTIAAGGLTVDAGGVTVGGGGLSVASGGATITAGGLTVTDGGASISKTTDAATLTLSNTFATLTKTVLDMATTDTAGFFFIDAKVGSTPTSVFKVDATGATTIAAGGLTVTKGGATIADNTDMSTLTLTNTVGTLTNTVLALNSADTDGTGFLFIDAKLTATPTSVFKVDATGATTIAAGGLTVGGGVTVSNTGLTVSAGGASITGGITAVDTGVTVTKGGARIADDTDINTLKLTNTFATLTKTVLDMATTDTAGFFFIDAKVGSTPTSVFKVDATGATTIAAGGLTVTKGGATIADNTDMSTLTLTNTVGTLTNTVLALNSADTDGTGFLFIDAKLTATPTSVFKVDATGATTIAAGGLTVGGGVTVSNTGLTVSAGGASITGGITAVDTGVTVTKGGARIADDTDINTLKLTNTFATLTKTVLDMATTDTAGFFFIDAKVGSTPTSVFKVDATGATTIAVGGLTVTKGGATIADNTDMSTLTLTNTVGTLTNTVLALNSADTDGTGFLFIDAKLTATPTSVFKVDATGATTIAAGGLTVGGGVTVSNTGLTVSAGGASITGGITAVDTGVTVTKGGARIADDTDINTLKLTNTFATLTKTVLDMATTDTAGFFFIDAKVGSTPTSVFKVDATGATTIAAGGLTVDAGGVTVGGGGLSVASGGATITAGGLTVTDGGASISKTTDAATLTLSNTFATLTKTVLDMATTDTAGFFFIDAKVGSTPTSVFKVDATGATTIAAGGLTVGGGVTVSNTGLTVSAGGASITGGITAVDTGVTVTTGGARVYDVGTAADTLTVKNKAASGSTFTGALLSVDTTALTSGFSLIDAKAAGVSQFTITAGGRTTIVSGGLTVTAGGAIITAGGLSVTNDGASIGGGLTVSNTGLTVSAGGASITGGITAVDTGVTVTKGGARIADDTDINTLKLTNTFATLTKTVLDMATTDTAGFFFIDAKVGSTPTSVFKVDATGATTIAAGGLTVGGGVTVSNTGLTVSAGGASITGGITAVDTGVTVTKGGARIADDTDINTLKLTNTFATLTKTVLDMATTDTAGFFFIDAKVGSTPTSVFKVDATGATTIAAGGLTVTKGGATIADNTDMSTLTLTNTVGTLTNTVLALNSADTDGTGFLFIDAKLTATPTSVFKVDATGATTIAAGGLTVGGGVTVSNTGLTVSAGGASITGGITAVDTGVTVTTGGARVYDTGTTADTLTVKNTATTGIFSGALLSLDTSTLTTGFSLISASVAGGSPKFSVEASGLTTIAAGGLSVAGGVTITNTGLTVTTGGASITDTGTTTSTLTLTNSNNVFDKALLSMDSTATSGFSLISAKVGGTPQFTVTAGGATTIYSGGLSIKGGVTVVDTGITVSAGDVLISSNTQSGAANSGALVVTGGVGVGRDLRCAGTIYGTVNSSSDRRLKTAIRDVESSQEIIRQLRPVTYKWRRDEIPARNFPAGEYPGFLADEVERILPDLVQEDGDGWKSLNYVGIIPHLVRAVQEMQGQLETSQSQMARMQQQIDAMLAARA